MKTGIFFDLDGTLWDAVESITTSWNIKLKELGYSIELTPAQLQKEMGKLMEDIADSVFTEIEKPTRYDVLSQCMDYEMKYLKEYGGILYPEVEETLKQLKEGYFLAVISNGQETYVKDFIEFFHFEKYFDDYEEAGRAGFSKDINIELVAKRNHLERVFYVGDIEGDMIAAEKAGATFVHAAYGFGKVPEDRLKINAFKDLPNLLKNL